VPTATTAWLVIPLGACNRLQGVKLAKRVHPFGVQTCGFVWNPHVWIRFRPVVYPQLPIFMQLMRELDPERKFSNAHVDLFFASITAASSEP